MKPAPEHLGNERAELQLCLLPSPAGWDVEPRSSGLFFLPLPEKVCASHTDQKLFKKKKKKDHSKTRIEGFVSMEAR